MRPPRPDRAAEQSVVSGEWGKGHPHHSPPTRGGHSTPANFHGNSATGSREQVGESSTSTAPAAWSAARPGTP